MPTTVVLTFDRPLDLASARNVKNYQITGPGGVKIAIRTADYDAAKHTVTLHPSQRISIHHPYKLVDPRHRPRRPERRRQPLARRPRHRPGGQRLRHHALL